VTIDTHCLYGSPVRVVYEVPICDARPDGLRAITAGRAFLDLYSNNVITLRCLTPDITIPWTRVVGVARVDAEAPK
jgi:hypothetical protein